MSQLFSIPLKWQMLSDDRQDVSWVIPEEAEAALQAHYPDPAVTLEMVFRQRLMREAFPYGWDWMLVVLPGRYPIGGYLAEARRGAKENMILMDHRLFAGLDFPAPNGPVRDMSLVFPTFPVQGMDVQVSMFWVATRGLLTEFGRRSGGWLQALADRLGAVPSHGTWVYYADAPEARDLADMSKDNEARYRAWADVHLGPRPVPLRGEVGQLRVRMLLQCAYEARGEQRIRFLREYLRLRPGDARSWGALAFTYHLENQVPQAIAAARKACRLAPGWHFPGYLQAYNQLMAERFQAAAATCRRLLARSPCDLATLQVLQRCLFETGETTERREVLQILCRLDEDHCGNAFDLGGVYYQQGDYREAAALFGRVALLEPLMANAWNNLGYALALLGEYDIALKACTHACGMRRTASHLDSVGFIHMKQGRYDEAIALFREALALDPDHAETKEHLAEAEALCGKG